MEAIPTFNWTEELESTVIKSLTTSFGLDSLLFEDSKKMKEDKNYWQEKGWNVDTIHNVRQEIYGTETERLRYENREKYDSDKYHKDPNYIEKGTKDNQAQADGTLVDPYLNKTMSINEKRDLDHVQSAKEIHNDPARILAELDGVKLANRDSNLASTNHSVNRSKQADSATDFLKRLETSIPKFEASLVKKEDKLTRMPKNTPEEQNKYRQLEDDIRKDEEKIKSLKSIDKESFIKKDAEARKVYNQEINYKYYTSSKFLGNAANDAVHSGFKMGARQMIGLIMAEIWFELRNQIPIITEKHKSHFQVEEFLNSIANAIKSIWVRLAARFNDFLVSFKDGIFSGALSSTTTTILNIFATSEKMVVKMIREMWSSLVQAFKLIVFNPQDLSSVDLIKVVTNILSVGVATLIGTTVYSSLLPVLNFPFGAEIAAFMSALVTGLVTLSFQYFINYSEIMKKVWNFLESSGFDISHISDVSHIKTLEKFKKINFQLDKYLEELTSLEFNFRSSELQEFSNDLAQCTTEIEKSFVLLKEIKRHDISLPFEMGSSNSTRAWLSSLAK